MNLQTYTKLDKQLHHQIDYTSKLMLLGSCFSENIGSKFEYHKFQSEINPFGILFHPIAVENLITRSINKDFYKEDDLISHNEIWSCFDAHSKMNAFSKKDLLNNLNDTIESTHKNINTATHLIITLGTAWVYRYIASDRIVANCHKIPQKQFLKELLPIDDIVASLEKIVALVRSVNPEVNFIFTVSPVRHLKDGFVENNQSKAHLLAAIHQLVEPRKRLFYFPSYEIMMDELRDYRFYNQDMIHPNDVAIDYIWEKFKTVWLTQEAILTLKKVASIQAKKAHRPFHPNSEAHRHFLQQLKIEIDALQKEVSHIKFD
ncbi:GSCFA domain-containing protein [Winogradskyella aquimaris]|uniref:GSCFA domain-containing protein n=1 Tax=Winogradskyella aquimaris TaxID=864074 RepID=A0ABU5EQU8_9FLAO|nr:GSCFA domain-containing protein [Winogradskyella aquimaris]MDY2587898.1 GSCFA domain-containing protein [Winogradskyella aquimaris]